MPSLILFVGGVLDGRRIDVPDSMEVYQGYHETVEALDDFRESRPLPERDLYDRMHVAGNSQTYSVFKLQVLTPDDVMRFLLEGYRRQ